mgnify:CR=1 FL=1
MKKRICILASGSGTNCENIIRYFQGNGKAEIAFVLSNKPDAYALVRARRLGVKTYVMTKAEINDEEKMLGLMRREHVDFIVLAGFLLLIPGFLIDAYDHRMINIHPALLPKFGGKGMYGRHVHEAVCAAGEKESGITIHFVTEGIDEGEPIAQFSTPLTPGSETPDTIAEKIHRLEQAHFPDIIATIATTHRQA